MPGGGAHLDLHLAQGYALAVAQALDRELGVGSLPITDRRAGLVGELEVAGDEIGVEVSLDDALDRQLFMNRVGEVSGDVALRIDDDGATGGLVADQVRGL